MHRTNQPVHIFHVTDTLTPGGTERIVVDMVNGLWQRGISVGVCVTRDETQLAVELIPDVPVLVLNRHSTWHLEPVYRFAKYCHQSRVQLLHAHGRGSVRFAALLKALDTRDLKLLFHDHYGELLFDQKASLSLRMISRFLVDQYLAVDPNLQRWAIQKLGIPKAKTDVLPNAIDLRRFDPVETYSRELLGVNKPVVGIMVANLRPQKDHLLLFEALAQSRYARERLHVLLVGLDVDDVYSNLCHQRIHELGLSEQITFLGKRLDIPRLLYSVDIGLLSSRSESGPVALLEYAIAGLPFVSTLTGQVAHFFEAHKWPFLVHPGDVTAYTRALDEIVCLTIKRRKELSLNAKQLVYQHFGVERQVDQVIKTYQQLGLDFRSHATGKVYL